MEKRKIKNTDLSVAPINLEEMSLAGHWTKNSLLIYWISLQKQGSIL
jgi:hypothetical protein